MHALHLMLSIVLLRNKKARFCVGVAGGSTCPNKSSVGKSPSLLFLGMFLSTLCVLETQREDLGVADETTAGATPILLAGMEVLHPSRKNIYGFLVRQVSSPACYMHLKIKKLLIFAKCLHENPLVNFSLLNVGISWNERRKAF